LVDVKVTGLQKMLKLVVRLEREADTRLNVAASTAGGIAAVSGYVSRRRETNFNISCDLIISIST
jgi:hypothetical protein